MADAPNLTPEQQFATAIAGIFSGATSLGNTDKNNASQVADVADPFRNQRPQYMDQMSQFMKNPGAIFNDPAFLSAQAVGGEAVARNAGAAGFGNSGNKMAELFKYGQSSALDFEKQKYNELLPLTGATTGSPAAAALATQAGQQNKQNGLSAGVAGLAGLLTQMGIPQALARTIADSFGGGGGSGGMDLTGSGVSGDMATDTGGAAGSFVDWNTGGDVSTGDANIVNDIFSGGSGIPDVSSLFGP